MTDRLHHLQIRNHEILIDGNSLPGVDAVTVDYVPGKSPEAYITMSTLADVDEDVLVDLGFDGDDIYQCLRYLRFMTRMDESFHEACVSIINSVLDSEQYGSDSIAEAILDKLLEQS